MDRLIAGLIGLIVGGTIGAVLGRLFGKSEAEQEIQALQQMCERLMAINAEREAEVQGLRRYVRETRAEIREIEAHRTGILKFFVWLFAEFPEVIRLYRRIRGERRRNRERLAEIDRSAAALQAEIEEKIRVLNENYPEEMAELGREIDDAAA